MWRSFENRWDVNSGTDCFVANRRPVHPFDFFQSEFLRTEQQSLLFRQEGRSLRKRIALIASVEDGRRAASSNKLDPTLFLLD